MDKKHVKLSVIGFAILLIGLVSVSYAFFNYTRTGEANTIRTGNIYFSAEQGQALNITNAFPMTSTEAGNANLDTVTLGILGNTTYADGEEFKISLVDVTNTISNKEVPMNYIATYTANTGGSIGASSDTYWTARNSKNANIYTLTSSGEVEEGKQVLVGYIKSGATGINGTLSISAYIDADRVAISDTYYGNATSTPLPTGPNNEYGTTTEWVNGRTVFTTTEWNSISSNPVSFKIKAESQEGIWVGEPTAAQIIAGLSGLENVGGAKRYVGASVDNYVMFNNEQWRIIGVYGDMLKIIKNTPSSSSPWDSNNSNSWAGSSLETSLNGTYYDSLSAAAKEMVYASGTWNTGIAQRLANANDAYSQGQATTITRKVGIIATYEYLYASGISCRGISANSTSCINNNWLASLFSSSIRSWTINPAQGYTHSVLLIYSSGSIDDHSVVDNSGVYPVVYLKPEVKISGGTGASGSEYTLNYTAS